MPHRVVEDRNGRSRLPLSQWRHRDRPHFLRLDKMQALIAFFWKLTILRRGPQDMPESSALAALLLVLNLAVNIVVGSQMFGGIAPALGANLMDAALTAVGLYLVLRLYGFPQRWLQTVTAFWGVGAFVGTVMLCYQSLLTLLGMTEVIALFDLLLVLWVNIALANVLRHSMEIPMFPALLVIFAFTMLSFTLITRFFAIVPPVS